jgi:hypothetical protein
VQIKHASLLHADCLHDLLMMNGLPLELLHPPRATGRRYLARKAARRIEGKGRHLSDECTEVGVWGMKWW